MALSNEFMAYRGIREGRTCKRPSRIATSATAPRWLAEGAARSACQPDATLAVAAEISVETGPGVSDQKRFHLTLDNESMIFRWRTSCHSFIAMSSIWNKSPKWTAGSAHASSSTTLLTSAKPQHGGLGRMSSTCSRRADRSSRERRSRRSLRDGIRAGAIGMLLSFCRRISAAQTLQRPPMQYPVDQDDGPVEPTSRSALS